MIDRIVIVGGGFAGFWAALAARRVAGELVEVTMISREPILQMRPRLYEAHPESLGVDLLPLLREVSVSFEQGEAVCIDVDRRIVELASGTRVEYGKLVVATGSQMRRPPIPGADEAFSIDTLAEATAFDRCLSKIASTVANPRMAVVGAGFTGVELALELRDRLATHGGYTIAEAAHIVLIDRADSVGSELGPGPRDAIEAALNDANVDVWLGANIVALSPRSLTLVSGEVHAFDAVVLTTGMEAAPYTQQVPGKRDHLGRIVVDATLRAPAAPDVFVTGDAAAADTGDGHLALQSCQHALQLGRFAGENAARDLLGLPLLEYSQPRYVTCLDLGRAGAVFTHGWERAVVESGDLAKARKRRINQVVIYPPPHAARETLLEMSSIDQAD